MKNKKSEAMTQIDKVAERINEVGYIDNFWCIQHRILRLSAIVLEMQRRFGWEVKKKGYGVEMGFARKFKKNYYYYIN